MALRILSLELPVDILLELLHVEELERLLQLQLAVGQLEDVVGDLCQQTIISRCLYAWRGGPRTNCG